MWKDFVLRDGRGAICFKGLSRMSYFSVQVNSLIDGRVQSETWVVV